MSEADAARLQAAAAAYDELTEGYSSFEDMPEDVAAQAQALSDEIDAISAKRTLFDPEVVARGGAFVTLGANGEVRIERGLIRAEDEPEPADASGIPDRPEAADGETPFDDEGEGEADDAEAEDMDVGKPLSDGLIRDLSAHRTLGLRIALGEQPEMAMVALTHALAAQLFYRSHDAYCLELRLSSEHLGGHAEGIADTAAAEALAARHDGLAADLPSDPAGLWAYLAALDADRRTALLAHCVALSVNAVRLPWARNPRVAVAADTLAEAVALDMTATWTPTARSYFGRVTKAHIAEAVAEAVSPEAAERITPMKKGDMADAAEQLVAATGWLPPLLRTRQAEAEADTPRAEEPLAVAAE